LTGKKDAIEYFADKNTPIALAAKVLFYKGKKKKAVKALVKDQLKDGSWNNSLAETVQKLELLLSLGMNMKDPHVAEAVEWIFWRQGLEHSYREVFPSPTESEMKGHFALPTGEKLPSRVSYCHIYGELSLRVLLEAGAESDPRVTDMLAVFDNMVKSSRNGIYCCKNCTGSFWQVASRFPQYRMYVSDGLKTLRENRTGSGSWKGFPFYHILQTLGRIKGLTAIEEFEYALPRISRSRNIDGSWGKTFKNEKTFAVLSGIHALRIGEV